MGVSLINDSIIRHISDEIRNAAGTDRTYMPVEIPNAIRALTVDHSSYDDLSYLPASDPTKVLVSVDYFAFNHEDGAWPRVGKFILSPIHDTTSMPDPALFNTISVDSNGLYIPWGYSLIFNLVSNSTSNTIYLCAKTVTTKNTAGFMLHVPYANSNGNDPSFYIETNGRIYGTVYASNKDMNLSSYQYSVLAISIDDSTKKVKYFVNGSYRDENTYAHHGPFVVVCGGDPFVTNGDTYNSRDHYFKYAGVVNGVESEATIISNMQAIMEKLRVSA